MGSPSSDAEDVAPVCEEETAPAVDPASPKRDSSDAASEANPGDMVYPTDEEMATLRHVHGKVNWLIYSIGIVELVERFAYYGTTAVCTSPSHPPPEHPS
ncbi:hypothetical protein IMZ48_11130 [Candidatus Bathyarchaeota archaeon]|nr:hypothetical protein [Candidatus Bathyarchaeota archaeon]